MPADAKVTVDVEKAKKTPDEKRSLAQDYSRRLGENIKLTEEQESRIKKWLKKNLREFYADVEPLHQKLHEDYQLSEGELPLDYYPFEGSSDIHLPITETYMDIFESVERRSILGADMIWYGETDLDDLRPHLADVEDMMNFKARNEWNIEESIEDVIPITNRDGTAYLEIIWAEDYEPANDILLFTNEAEFLSEFPTPDSGDMEEDEWKGLLEMVRDEATPETPIEIPVTFEKLTYYGNKAEVVEYIDFIKLPANAKSIKHPNCRGYGKRFYSRSEVIRKMAKDKFYYKKAAENLIEKRSGKADDNRIQREQLHGIARSNRKDDFELIRLTVIGNIDGKQKKIGNDDDFSGERKYHLTYSLEHHELLQFIEYPYRVDNYAKFTIDRRINTDLGRSIPEKIRRINEGMDILHNQDIDSGTIANVPSFKGKKKAKKDFDTSMETSDQFWAPGKIFWLDDPDAFDQFKVQPSDPGFSIRHQDNYMKLIDLRLGSAGALLSGQTAPGDPEAPGNKTAMMLQQSNLRMEDPLNELRSGVEETGMICLSHLYQFGPPLIEFQGEVGTPTGTVTKTKSIHRKYLRSNIRLKMNGVTVIHNPDTEFQKRINIFAILMQLQEFSSNPELRINFMRDALRAARFPNRNKYLPSSEEIKRMAVEIQKQAIREMQAQQQEQQQKALQDRLGQARTKLNAQNTAANIAEQNLGFNGAKQ